ncbi:MAG: hypothetical protein QME64_11310 [bacterium]|nr:hypothetical protein [bacterium]
MPCACAIPIIIGSVSLLSNAFANVAATLGYSVAGTVGSSLLKGMKQQQEQAAQTTVVIPFEESAIFEEQRIGKKGLQFNKEGISISLFKDDRGKYSLKLTASGKTSDELKAIGTDMKERITQQYVYHKVLTGLKNKRYVVVAEEMNTERTVRVVLRRYD